MRVTEKDVAYVADLANLELTEHERQRMLKDLNSILDYIDRVNELDTSSAPPMTQISGSVDGADATYDRAIILLRKDELIPCLPHAEAMKNAPVADGEF